MSENDPKAPAHNEDQKKENQPGSYEGATPPVNPPGTGDPPPAP